MKKLVNGILALTLCLSVVGQMTAAVPLQIIAADEAAENTVTVDGLTYQLYFSDIEGISDYAELVGVEDQDITSVTIPAEVNGCKVTYVKSGIFSECKNLEQINTENTEKDAAYSIDGVLFTHESLLNAYPPDREGAYVIPDGTKTIGMEAFKNASKLTSVTLPDSLVKIDMLAFSECTALEEVIGAVESRFTKLQNVDKLTVYGTEIFKYTQQDCEEAGVPFALLEQNSGDTNDDTIAMRFVLRDDVDVSAAAEQMAEVLDEYFPGLKDGLDTQSGIISYKIPRDPSDDSNIPYRVMLFQSAYWGGEGNSRIFDLTMPMCYFPEDAETIEAEVLLAFARRQLISEFYGWGETADYETRYFSDDVLAHHDMTQYVRNQNPTGHNALEKPGDVTLDCEIDIVDVIAANKAILGASTLCNTAKKNCDINGDGTPDTTDALAILKEVVGLTTNFAEP